MINSVKDLSKLMQSKYQMSLMGEMSYFLGLQIKQSEDGIFINQEKYTRNLLKRFNLQECATATTPMVNCHQTWFKCWQNSGNRYL